MMVSLKERQRLAQVFDKAVAAMGRQKAIIDRLALANMEATAALMEIADNANQLGHKGMQERAKQALDRMKDLAAANADKEAESTEREIPAPSEEVGEASEESN